MKRFLTAIALSALAVTLVGCLDEAPNDTRTMQDIRDDNAGYGSLEQQCAREASAAGYDYVYDEQTGACRFR